MKRIFGILLACLFMIAAMAVMAMPAFAAPPGPGDDQCKGQKKNPHCPSGKFHP